MKQRTYWKTIGHFFPFKAGEVKGILLSMVVLGFIFSFADWGYEKFDILIGLKNLIFSMFMAAIAMFAHQAGSRLFGIKRGYRVEFKVWFFGLIIGLMVIFISNGKFWFIAPGGIIIHHLAGHRLGYFRYGLNYLDISKICFFGVLGNVFMVVLCKMLLGLAPANLFLTKLMMINFWMAIWSMVPIPPLDGANIAFASRLEYVFFLVATVTALFLMIRYNWVLSITISILFAAVVWTIYWWWASGDKVGRE